MHPLLKSLADNQELFDAVKNKIMEKFSFEISNMRTDTFDDKQLGEFVRSRLDGRSMVEEAFRDIATLKTVKEEETFNQAR